MVTKLNTYESVPIGTSNFEDFLSYIRSFLGANFGFSTNALDNNGGYFLDDNFGWVQFGTTSPNRAWIFTPQGKPEGNLFGRKNSEYFRLLVLNAEGQLPQVNKWEVLVTSAEEYTGGVALRNRVETDPITSDPVVVKPLPYRPLRVEPTFDTAPGYYDIRLNGIPQDINSVTFTVDPTTSFHNQNVEFTSFRLGAEFPNPVRGGRYDGSLGPSGDGFTDLLDLNDPLRYGTPMVSDPTTNLATLEFPHTNFSIDYGGHILLWNYGDRYSYIPQDISSSPDPAPGTYKVLDFARGIIKLNVTADQLDALGSFSKFTVISAEHLQESSSGGIPSYHSRYGSVYDGNTSLVKLVRYTFDGLEHRAIQMDTDDISASSGSILTSDISGSFGDSVILAIEYYGTPNLAEIESVQSTRYEPDILTFFYSVGMHNHIGGSTTSNFRGLLEHNDASWYNRDVLDADYFPVSRIRNTWYSPITTTEAALWDDGVFDLNFSFAIVDTIQLQELADVPSNLNDGDILEYNGTTFDNTPFELKHLNDVNINPSSATDRFILNYNHNTNSWIESSITGVHGVDRRGDTGILGELRYNPLPSLNNANSLINKGYVDTEIAGINTTISGLVTIEPGTGLDDVESDPNTNVKKLSVKYGNSAGTAAEGNDSRIVNAVPNTRTLLGGSGISVSGTGTLSANRTISVDSSVVRTSRFLSGGAGISVSGNGDLSANRTISVDSTVIVQTGSQIITGLKEHRTHNTSSSNTALPALRLARTGNTSYSHGAGIDYLRYATNMSVQASVYAGLSNNQMFSIFNLNPSNNAKTESLQFSVSSSSHPVISAAGTSNTSLTLSGANSSSNVAPTILLRNSSTTSLRRGVLSIGSSPVAYWNSSGLFADALHINANSTTNDENKFATRGYVDSKAASSGADVSNAPSSWLNRGYVRIGDLFICQSAAKTEPGRGSAMFEGPTLPVLPSGRSYTIISATAVMLASSSNYLAHSVVQTTIGTKGNANYRPSPQMDGRTPVGAVRVNTVSNSSGNAWSALMTWLVVVT